MTDSSSSKSSGIIGWFASNPVAANLLMILVILLGVLSAPSIRREAYPNNEPNRISISVNYQSGSAKQSEEGLAIKIEEQLDGINGIKSITSTATSSGATVVLEKESTHNLDTLLRDVKTRVDAISTFPADAKKPVIQKAEREERAIWLQLHGDTDRQTLQRLAQSLKDDLLAQPDIHRVTISGWLNPMIAIEIDEARLQSYGLSLSNVEESLNRYSSTPLTAVLRNDSTNLQLQAAQQAYTALDFAEIPLITTTDGQIIRLDDVAVTRDTFDDSAAVMSRFNGHPSLALQVITTAGGDIGDSVNAAKRVESDWLNQGKLPYEIQLTSWNDQSENINDRLNLLVKNALSGILLVFVFLALFLNFTVALWVAAGLPFIFFGTLFVMGDSMMGMTLNFFSTFGFIMALGIVVDDAVVVGESVYTTRSRYGDTLDNTIRGTRAVAVPTLFGAFTTVAAFFALSNIEGVLGTLYSQFALVVTICLIFSVVESKLILPAHLSHLNTRTEPTRQNLSALWRYFQRLADNCLVWFTERCYRPLIDWTIAQRYTVVVCFTTLLVLVVSLPMTGAIRISFFPDIPGEMIHASLTMHNDASFGMTHRNLLAMEKAAHQIDKQLGNSEDASYISHLQVLSENDLSGSIRLELKKTAPYDTNTFIRQWRKQVGLPEGAKTVLVQSSPYMIDALEVELRANDDNMLLRAGSAFREKLEKLSGVSGISDNLNPGQPQLNLQLSPLGESLQLSTTELATQVLQAFSGQVVQRYQRNSDEIEVKVRYPQADRHSANDVLDAKIRISDGSVLPLTSVAEVNYGYSRDSIHRINGKRAVYVSADVDKEILSATELVRHLQNEIAPQIKRDFPGLDIYFGGEAEQQAETQHSMVQMLILALLAIYMLIAIPLRSYVQPVLVMAAIPFGAVGAIIGHWMNDLSLGIMSLNGIIALSGVVVNDSLLLTNTFNERRANGQNLRAAIVDAGTSRLRAVLLTSVTTFLGLLPLMSGSSQQAQVLIPAAISLAYGILFATVITLVLIPSLLVIRHDISALVSKIRTPLSAERII